MEKGMKKKTLPPTYFFYAIVLMIALHFLLPVSKILRFPWNLLGLVPLVVGAILNLIADRDFKRAGTTVKPYEKSTTLVTSGVFRISRNPMYLGMVLILFGIAVLMGTLSPYTIVILFAVLMDQVFIKVEERMLEEVFGETWQEYKMKVRRWI